MIRVKLPPWCLLLMVAFYSGLSAAPAQEVRMRLEDDVQATQTAQPVRMSFDDGPLSADRVRMSLDDWQVDEQRARMSFSDDERSLASSWFQEDAAIGPVDELLFAASATHWLTAGYLMMWTKGTDLPALVTTSTPGTPRMDAGVLGLPNTSTLFGGERIDGQQRNGLRVNYGHWLNENQNTGFEADYFSVFDDASSGDFFAASTGTPILARPFYNVSLDAEDSELVAFPSVVEGGIDISNTSEAHSVALLLRRNHRSGPGGRIDALAGYRHFRFRDGIRIHESLVATDPGGLVPIGTTFEIFDAFRAENEFHGGELGVHAQFYRGMFTCELLAKVALGQIRRDVLIDGSTTVATPGVFSLVTTSEGGLLALPTNMGRTVSTRFAALPEFGVNVSMAVTDRLSLKAGYSLVALNDVIRSGDVIDRLVNPTQLSGGALVGDARPALQLNESDFWMQGLSLLLMIEG